MSVEYGTVSAADPVTGKRVQLTVVAHSRQVAAADRVVTAADCGAVPA